jgi:hypothetical protein
MQRAQQSGREAARGSHPGAGRDIGQADDFKVWPGYSCQLQSFADDGMLNLLDAIDCFELGILDDDAGTEILVDSDVNVTRNCG